jgi:YfiH family protein
MDKGFIDEMQNVECGNPSQSLVDSPSSISQSYMTLPPVPDTFRWTEESWGAALRCRPLEDVAPHLFTTRQLQLSSVGDGERLAAAVGASALAMLTQVHGAEVVILRDNGVAPAGRPEADVLVSDARRTAIAVRAADCVPLLMADPVTGGVAAVHAGWRGTVARAAVVAVNALEREFGARPGDLVVAIGPCIGPCCYEVGSELVDAFAAAGHERHLIDRWFRSPPPPRGSTERPRLRLDVAGANRDQLVLAGVAAERIHIAGLCTAMHLDVLTSYRIEKEHAGRLAGVIRRR